MIGYQNKQFSDAVNAFAEATRISPNDATLQNYLGCADAQSSGLLSGAYYPYTACREFQKAIEIDPKLADAHFNLALVYAVAVPSDVEKARKEYQEALDLGASKDEKMENLLK